MFLHYLLNQDKTMLLSQMIYEQINNPIKNDWLSLAKQYLIDLGLNHYSLEDIKIMKKFKIKKKHAKTLP